MRALLPTSKYTRARVLGHILTELTEVAGQGMGVLPELPEAPRTGTEVLQNFKKFRVL